MLQNPCHAVRPDVAGPGPCRAKLNLLDALRRGEHILLLRHAVTRPGLGDPQFRARRLRRPAKPLRPAVSRPGAQSMAARRGSRWAKVRSQWCRCRYRAAGLRTRARNPSPGRR